MEEAGTPDETAQAAPTRQEAHNAPYGRHSFAHTTLSPYQVVTHYHVQCGGHLSAYTELSPYQLMTRYRDAADFSVYAHDMPAEIESKERRDAMQRE